MRRTPLNERWVAALRSGDFQQGRNYLKVRHAHDGVTRYCCLGVLCEIAEEFVGTREHDDGSVTYVLSHENGGGLTGELMDRWGVTPLEHSHLVQMNDDDGESFDEIADWIEEQMRHA